ncbi:MAG TPA: hypothetical protein VJL84_00040, partial [Kiloniellales bacterium]|nr:hypothetical protein [Kiloniellales bacterium]
FAALQHPALCQVAGFWPAGQLTVASADVELLQAPEDLGFFAPVTGFTAAAAPQGPFSSHKQGRSPSAAMEKRLS